MNTPARLHAIAIAMALVAAVGIAGCASAIPHPKESDVSAAREAGYQDATLPQLARGRDLYVQNCAGCHALFTPEQRTPEQWPDDVADMRQDTELTDAEADAVTRYLVAASARRPAR